MKIIIDTHIFLWFVTNDEQLDDNVKQIISNSENIVYISIASFWEISIKLSLQKLTLDITLDDLFEEASNLNFSIQEITQKHLTALITLPWHHRDPFDRLIIAQSQSDCVPIISADRLFKNYNILRIGYI